MKPGSVGNMRKAERNDLPRILEIERQSFRDPYAKETFEDMVDDASNFFLVFEIDRNIVGYTVAKIETSNKSHLLSLAVHPDHRRKGIGRALISSVFVFLSGRNCAGVYLECRQGNLGAQRLYEEMGFRRVGIIPLYYQDEDAVLYWKRL